MSGSNPSSAVTASKPYQFSPVLAGSQPSRKFPPTVRVDSAHVQANCGADARYLSLVATDVSGREKVGKPTRMVKIEMCQNNMPHIRRVNPSASIRASAVSSCPPLDIIHQAEKADKPGRGGVYRHDRTRIHPKSAHPVRFNQQTVAEQMRVKPFTEPIIKRAAKRAHATTVEVVNFH